MTEVQPVLTEIAVKPDSTLVLEGPTEEVTTVMTPDELKQLDPRPLGCKTDSTPFGQAILALYKALPLEVETTLDGMSIEFQKADLNSADWGAFVTGIQAARNTHAGNDGKIAAEIIIITAQYCKQHSHCTTTRRLMANG
eukprot:TRINITY_DN84686_c0_g1_i1.p1 TRINITY_DN84686_c0_g1~~TRINITY_DN84686_c0_g1_i1.p1  ORF type:complete len:162 (+),score=15.12 TRINITY_DN84686_c0_g1_i1:67-486(+)